MNRQGDNMEKIIFFLGEKDLLYRQLCKVFEYDIKVFDSNCFKNSFDDNISYIDLSDKTAIEKFIISEIGDYKDVTLIVSDELVESDDVNKYVTKVERLLYGAVFTSDFLINNKPFEKINIIIISKVHNDILPLTDNIYPNLFKHISGHSLNGTHKNLNTHLIYLVHDMAYNIDSYAKIEFGYSNEDEMKLKEILNKKIEKISDMIKAVVNERKSEIDSNITWIRN